ncbi:MAG: hypothetical protein IH966_00210 [Gemmatimonadetes bacterium]|nr:hypothetical protein [Gemmatimonadota bacterium]
MKRFKTFAAALTMGSSLLAGPAVAQMNSIPVYFNPKGGTGLMVAVDLGRGINDESGKNTAVAFRTALGIGPVTIGGSVGLVNPDEGGLVGRELESQYMGNIALRLFGGGLLPVSLSLQGGVGVLTLDDTNKEIITVPIGLGLGFSIPTPGFSFDPWIAGRYTFVRTKDATFPVAATANQNSFGISGGLNFNFLMGLGFHVAGDWQRNPAELSIPKTKPFVLGIGLNYTFRMPGLPGVPMVPGI